MKQLSSDGFADEFEACSQRLWCIAVAVLGDRGQAEDVLQEAALIALRKLSEFDPATTFAAWMGQIVRYVALNHARRRAHRKTMSVDPQILDESVPGPTSRAPDGLEPTGDLPADQSSFDDGVQAALMTLDGTARACLLLRTVLDLPYREIARTLDIPQGTAMSHVHRARKALREKLVGREPATNPRAGVVHG